MLMPKISVFSLFGGGGGPGRDEKISFFVASINFEMIPYRKNVVSNRIFRGRVFQICLFSFSASLGPWRDKMN
jgi:hypothetical protein